jgi:hypothetical protein
MTHLSKLVDKPSGGGGGHTKLLSRRKLTTTASYSKSKACIKSDRLKGQPHQIGSFFLYVCRAKRGTAEGLNFVEGGSANFMLK